MDLNKYKSSALETLLTAVENSLLVAKGLPLITSDLHYWRSEINEAIKDAKFEEERETDADLLINVTRNLN
jgi:hypothetical protein